MGDLSTYSLADVIPYTREVYLRLFVRFNEAVWPAHLVALALGALILWLALRGRSRILAGLLAICWAFVGYAFHIRLHADLNWAATYFGWAYLAQAALVLAAGSRGAFDRNPDAPLDTSGWIGVGLVAFALVIHPLLTPLTGDDWSGAEVFGMAPDPTVLATLGIAAIAEHIPWPLLAIPLLWCLVTGAIGWNLGVATGITTAAFGALGVGIALWRGNTEARKR